MELHTNYLEHIPQTEDLSFGQIGDFILNIYKILFSFIKNVAAVTTA
jgi:hypothetical protein